MGQGIMKNLNTWGLSPLKNINMVLFLRVELIANKKFKIGTKAPTERSHYCNNIKITINTKQF